MIFIATFRISKEKIFPHAYEERKEAIHAYVFEGKQNKIYEMNLQSHGTTREDVNLSTLGAPNFYVFYDEIEDKRLVTVYRGPWFSSRQMYTILVLATERHHLLIDRGRTICLIVPGLGTPFGRWYGSRRICKTARPLMNSWC